MDFEDKFFANQGLTPESSIEPKEEPKQEETPSEEPKQEAPQEEPAKPEQPSSLNTETPPSEDNPPSKPEEQPSSSAPEDDVFEVETDEDLAKFVSDHYGKEISVERLKSILEEQQEFQFANDTVKELNDYIAQGGDLNNFLEFKMTDYSQMSDLDIVTKKMQRDYPDLSKEEIQRKLNREFKLDENRYDEDEIADGKVDLRIAAQEARKQIQELQSKYATPVQTTKTQTQQEPEFSEAEIKQFQSDMQNSISNLKTIEINGMKYEVSDSLREKVAQSPADIGDLFVDDKGSFNFDKYNQIRAIALDPDNFVKTAVEHGKAIMLQELKEKRNNTTLEPETHTPSNVVDSKKAQEALIQEYMGGGKRYGF